MKLGIASTLPHTSPEEWAKQHLSWGLKAVVFPCHYQEDIHKIDAYKEACQAYGLQIAEVGCWCNPLAPDPAERKANLSRCIHQLELADYVQADCCVNISGAVGPIWDGAYPENLTKQTYEKVVVTTQFIVDAVSPKFTCYSLEPSAWMFPNSPENYLQIVRDVDRSGFGVHMDMINMISSPEKYCDNIAFTQQAFALLGPYIKSCHIKDVLLTNRLTMQLQEMPCGEGGFDLANYIREIDALTPDMTVIIEHLESVANYQKAVSYIKNLNVQKV